MKKKIMFRKWDEQGNFKCEVESSRKYTVRGAMEHLESMGFSRLNVLTGKPEGKLCHVYTNLRGINAYIL